jgi:AraC-like DNA-binding protein
MLASESGGVTDPLSETLALIDARCAITGGIRAGGDWAFRFTPDVPVKLEAVVRGSCWLVADDRPPARLAAGDAVVLNHADAVVLCSDPDVPPIGVGELRLSPDDGFAQLGHGGDVLLIAGHVELDPAAAGLFRSALPDVLHAAASTAEAQEMRRILERIVRETREHRPGAAFAVDQHAQLLLLETLRIGLSGEVLAHPGWLRLIADPQLRPAVTMLHADPARAWGLPELAAVAGMSRSHFAHRFREVSGQTPLAYLAQWRTRLAERVLRTSDTSVAALGKHLGYASESSFSHAFTRIAGTSPSRYRQEARARRSGQQGAPSAVPISGRL